MSILKNMLQKVEDDKQAIENKVAQETFCATTEEENEMVQQITQQIAEKFRDDIAKHGMTEDVKEKIKDTIAEIAEVKEIDFEQQKRVEYLAGVNIVGLGPLDLFMNDDTVSEVVVQRWDNICIEKNGLIHPVSATFANEDHLRTVINRIIQPVGRQINLYTPIVDARLPDGSRVNATIPPITPDGATLTIRKFSKKLTAGQCIQNGTFDQNMLRFLGRCVKGKINIIIGGGTGAGKTSLLNILSSFINENELLVTIEDTCELDLPQKNVRRMETREIASDGMVLMNAQALIKNALRMRPDRIIVGEIRDGSIVDMMSAMSTGHEGSMSTVHANNPGNLMNSRMPFLYAMHPTVTFPLEAQFRQISESLQLVVQIMRRETDGKRKITHITHVSGLLPDGRVELKDIFLYDNETDSFKATGYVPKEIIRQAKNHGVKIPMDLFKKGSEEKAI